jgi:hypothetical protein
MRERGRGLFCAGAGRIASEKCANLDFLNVVQVFIYLLITASARD